MHSKYLDVSRIMPTDGPHLAWRLPYLLWEPASQLVCSLASRKDRVEEYGWLLDEKIDGKRELKERRGTSLLNTCSHSLSMFNHFQPCWSGVALPSYAGARFDQNSPTTCRFRQRSIRGLNVHWCRNTQTAMLIVMPELSVLFQNIGYRRVTIDCAERNDCCTVSQPPLQDTWCYQALIDIILRLGSDYVEISQIDYTAVRLLCKKHQKKHRNRVNLHKER